MGNTFQNTYAGKREGNLISISHFYHLGSENYEQMTGFEARNKNLK